MKNVVIHVGPPKTGTTSIQTFLQESSLRHVVYLGVFQPRHENDDKNHLRDDIYGYLSGTSSNPNAVSKIKNVVEDVINNRKIAVLSEEMILHGQNWRSKVRRLYDIFGEFDPRISICLREPKEALPSYYQEIYSSLSKDLRSGFSRFANSEYGDIYNYQEVERCFKSSGFQDIGFFRFDDLTGGNLFLRDLGLGKIPESNVRMNLSRKNKSQKANNGFRVVETNRIDEMDNIFSKTVGLLKQLGPPGRHANRAIRSVMETRKRLNISHVDKCDMLSKVYESYQSRTL